MHEILNFSLQPSLDCKLCCLASVIIAGHLVVIIYLGSTGTYKLLIQAFPLKMLTAYCLFNTQMIFGILSNTCDIICL